MFGLSIKQPWAHAIIHLGKDIENRDWQTTVRGTIAVHSSKKPDVIEFDIFDDLWRKMGREATTNKKVSDLSFGAIIGTVDIIDCVSHHESPWFYGKYGFVLANPKPLIQPIPFRGVLNFWKVPADIEQQILEQTK